MRLIFSLIACLGLVTIMNINALRAGTTTITEDTVLSGNLFPADLPIIIGANNITLDCRNFTLDCMGSGDDGIVINKKNNVTIKSCNIEGCDDAVNANFATNINILSGGMTGNDDALGLRKCTEQLHHWKHSQF